MTFSRPDHVSDRDTLSRIPSLITSAWAETLKDVAFLPGAALCHLHLVLGHEKLPHALLRDRLALRAAEACVAFSGRPGRAGEFCDTVHILRQGDLPGPAGETYRALRRTVERPVVAKALNRALPSLEPEQIAMWCDTGKGTPTPLQSAQRPTSGISAATRVNATSRSWRLLPSINRSRVMVSRRSGAPGVGPERRTCSRYMSYFVRPLSVSANQSAINERP
ncbi:DUF1403 family protein [Thioclava sp. BHET1]|nr:DUF1403 family protein [Thioclava sp. BHET1]